MLNYVRCNLIKNLELRSSSFVLREIVIEKSTILSVLECSFLKKNFTLWFYARVAVFFFLISNEMTERSCCP